MSIQQLDRRIQNVMTAKNNVTNAWAKNYWAGVLAYLLRAANRLN